MAYSFNINTTIKATVKLQFNINLLITFYTDFKLIYKCLIKLGIIQEKRHKISKIKQINRDSNPIDSITKSRLLSALKQFINTNQIKLKIVKWVKYATDNSIDLKA